MPWSSAWSRHLFADTLRSQSAAGRVRVEQLLADLACRFVTVDPHALGDAIADGLRRVAEALQLDRAVLGTTDQVPHAKAVASLPPNALKLSRGQAVSFARLDEVPDAAVRSLLQQHGVQSAALVPVPAAGGEPRGFVFAASMFEREWDPSVLEPLRLASGLVGLALARKAESGEYLRRTDAGAARTSNLIVRESAAIQAALEQIEQVAPTNATVLLQGETGVGKEVFAQAIHDLSPRRHRPMIRVSCAAIPTALIESELFGRERGAYTGAITRQIGRFEAAHQSTLFLDEIGDLPADIQVKLLRVLQERVVERLGSTQPIKVDVRIIAATNRNLEKAVEEKTFREDLFYRLNVFPVTVPPLRDRAADINGLVWEFVDEFSKSFGKPIESIAKESMRELQAYTWPGNVREFRNVIERAVILATGRQLTVPLRQLGTREPPKPMTLATFEADHIRATLESTNWRIRGAGGAAERLGLKPTTLESRMAKLGLVRPTR